MNQAQAATLVVTIRRRRRLREGRGNGLGICGLRSRGRRRHRIQRSVSRGIELEKLQVVIPRGRVLPRINHREKRLRVVVDHGDGKLSTGSKGRS